MTIRKLTDNKKSLDDFVKIFLGKGGNTGPLIVGYEFPEIVADLNQVVKYDWATFLSDRIRSVNAHADLAGIEQGGYKLVYLDHPSKSERVLGAAGSRRGGGLNVWYSLGIRVSGEGVISDVRYGGPSDKAKLGPGMKLLVVNGEAFSADALKSAVIRAKTDTAPIHLMVQLETGVFPIDLEYHDGERYPNMVRVEGTPAYLDDIVKARTTNPNPVPQPTEKAGQ